MPASSRPTGEFGDGDVALSSKVLKAPPGKAKTAGLGQVSPPMPAAPLQGWPLILDPAVAWDGSSIRHEEQYTYALGDDDIDEIEEALKYFKELGLDGHMVNRDNFPLHNLSSRIGALAEDLHSGRGFFALRGLDHRRYSREDNIVMFLGVSSYVGEMRGRQDDKGHIFAHIREAKYMEEAQKDRPIRDSNVASTFHTDLFCDILAMQTLSCAPSGGNHIVASVATIYKELLRTQPDVIPILAAPNWPFDTRGKLTPPDARPLLYYHGGQIMMNFVRDPLKGIESIARSKHLPRLTISQEEALDAVERIAQQHQRALTMQPGDLTFVNNLGVVHAREAFTDSPTQSRYLIRLWLKNRELAWSLPPQLARGNIRVFEDHEIAEDWNIVYKPRLQFQVAERLSP